MNAEAVLRFQTLREEYGHDASALEKYEKGILTVTLLNGEVCNIDDPEFGNTFIDIINEFQSNYPGYEVFHCLELDRIRLAVLYVGPNEDEWEMERIDEDGYMYCYVYNAFLPALSEPGEVRLG